MLPSEKNNWNSQRLKATFLRSDQKNIQSLLPGTVDSNATFRWTRHGGTWLWRGSSRLLSCFLLSVMNERVLRVPMLNKEVNIWRNWMYRQNPPLKYWNLPITFGFGIFWIIYLWCLLGMVFFWCQLLSLCSKEVYKYILYILCWSESYP